MVVVFWNPPLTPSPSSSFSGPMRLSLEREEHHLDSARHSTHEQQEYKDKVVAYYEERVKRIRELISSLESAQSLRESLQLPITQDAKDVVEDSLYDQLGMMEHTYLLAPRGGNAANAQSLNKVLAKNSCSLLFGG